MSVTTNLQRIWADLPVGVRLVAISKYHPKEAIEEAYAAGQRIFGESRVQEMSAKYECLSKDIEWHFIGHLQTNKIKHIVPYVSMIHSVDSYNLLSEIDRYAAKVGRIVNVLLQLCIAQEETKFGFSQEECQEMLTSGAWQSLTHARICGIMGMASNTDSEEQIEYEFCSIRKFFDEMKRIYFAPQSSFCELSIGMSHDYLIAIKAGTTLVRVGSKIFGDRKY
jgi:pyridoxal phosphate enzyme (YggS family)